MPFLQQRSIGQRAVDRAPQHPGAHRRDGGVEQRHQGRLLAAAGAGVDLEVATRDRIDLQRGFARFDSQGAQMGQGGALGIADELQQGARGANRERQL